MHQLALILCLRKWTRPLASYVSASVVSLVAAPGSRTLTPVAAVHRKVYRLTVVIRTSGCPRDRHHLPIVWPRLQALNTKDLQVRHNEQDHHFSLEVGMAFVSPLPRESLTEFEDLFSQTEKRMGFLPNSQLTMARKPELLKAFAALGRAANAPNPNIPPALNSMIAHVASSVAGCRYCMAHTASTAERNLSPEEAEKVERLGAFESDPIFSEKERVTLAFAAAAASVPNAVEERHFTDLKRFYDDDDIVEIVGVIAMFGFLNRWNDTMATELEEEPMTVGEAHLSSRGWTPGKHSG